MLSPRFLSALFLMLLAGRSVLEPVSRCRNRSETENGVKERETRSLHETGETTARFYVVYVCVCLLSFCYLAYSFMFWGNFVSAFEPCVLLKSTAGDQIPTYMSPSFLSIRWSGTSSLSVTFQEQISNSTVKISGTKWDKLWGLCLSFEWRKQLASVYDFITQR